MKYFVNNTEELDKLIELEKLILEPNDNELVIEDLSEKFNKIVDALITVEQLFEMMEDIYNNVGYGQKGNGYYITGSNTRYKDYIYGDDEKGEQVTLSYITGEILGSKYLIYAWDDN